MFNKRLYSSILLLCVFPMVLYALGEPPDFSDQEEEPGYIKMMNKVAMPEKSIEEESPSENILGENDDEAIFDQRKKVAQFIKLKQFPQAKNALEKIPTQSLKTEEISLLGKLMLFDSARQSDRFGVSSLTWGATASDRTSFSNHILINRRRYRHPHSQLHLDSRL